MYKKAILATLVVFLFANVYAQKEFIYTKEGKRILKREPLITSCLRYLHKDRTDVTALSICECQINKFDGHFTNAEYRKYNNSGLIDLSAMLKVDSAFEQQVQNCYTASGKTALIEAEGFENQYVKNCIKNIFKTLKKNWIQLTLITFAVAN